MLVTSVCLCYGRAFVLGDVDVFRYRCRNFVDSGVIGTREYVEEVGARLRAKVPGRKEGVPHRIHLSPFPFPRPFLRPLAFLLFTV